MASGADARSRLVGALQAERGGGVGAEEFFKAKSPEKYAKLVKRIKEGDTGAIAEFKEILRSIEANKPTPSPSSTLRVRPSNLQAAAGSIGDLDDVDLMGIEPDSPEKLADIQYRRELRGARGIQLGGQRELPPAIVRKNPEGGMFIRPGAHYPAYDYTGKKTRSWKPKPNAVLNRKEGYGLLGVLEGPGGDKKMAELVGKILNGGGRKALVGQARAVQKIIMRVLKLPRV